MLCSILRCQILSRFKLISYKICMTAQGGGRGNGVEGLDQLWALVARASVISRDCLPAGALENPPKGSKGGTGVRVRYAFSARSASLALGVAGWSGLAARPEGVAPLVSAPIPHPPHPTPRPPPPPPPTPHPTPRTPHPTPHTPHSTRHNPTPAPPNEKRESR
jgi:hypothetical protein